MPGCHVYFCLFLFAMFAKEVTVQMSLYRRVELKGEQFDQNTIDTLQSVEWIKHNLSSKCLCLFFRLNETKLYSQCCGRAHFYLSNNSLILENVTAHFEGVFTESIVTKNGVIKSLNFTLHILYPPNATGILVSWISNTSVSLRCEVTGSFTHLMWRRDSLILEDNRHSFSERNKTLHISNITCSDSVTYSCAATNEHGQSQAQTCITNENYLMHCENSTHCQEKNVTNVKPQIDQILIPTGLAFMAVLGLCIIFCVIYRCRCCHRLENNRITGGNFNMVDGIYEEVLGTETVSPLPWVYTDVIKPRRVEQNSAAAEPLEDFGYSVIGPAGREKTHVLDCINSDEQPILYPASEENSQQII